MPLVIAIYYSLLLCDLEIQSSLERSVERVGNRAALLFLRVTVTQRVSSSWEKEKTMAFAKIKILTLVFLASSLSFVSSDTEKIVNTTHGPVRGESIVLTTKKVLIRYLGIPFAQAKRFEAPQSPTSWTVPLNATSFGYSCWQGISIIVESNVTMSEDCLTVNVFIPETGSRLLPVMVFIYGGGFSFGSSAYRIYNGQYLATEGEVVVVTFNYRLGVLGFLSKGTKDLPGNYGLLDQVKALHWVQENIERYSLRSFRSNNIKSSFSVDRKAFL